MSTNIFVYGTLKNSQPNHKLMVKQGNGTSIYIGKGHTVDRYPLVIASPYNIPFLLDKKDTGHIIQGEMYQVDETMLHAMDELEDHPNFYQRQITPVIMTEDSKGGQCNTKMKCWVYRIKHFNPKLLSLPFHSNYNSRGDHGLEYIETKEKHDQLGSEVCAAVLRDNDIENN